MIDITSLLAEKFNILSDSEIKNGFKKISIENKNLKNCISFLKNSAEVSADILISITAADYKDYIELIYHLYSTKLNENIFISTNTDSNTPVVESVSSIFKSSTNDECEIFDLFGVDFDGNKNLKRLFLPKEYVGSPMLKGQKYEVYKKRYENKGLFSAFETQLQLETDGEVIKSAIPIIGKEHTGLEKKAEKVSYNEFVSLLDNVFFKEAFCSATEKLANIELSNKTKLTRTILCEEDRILSNLDCFEKTLSVAGSYSAKIQAQNKKQALKQLIDNQNVKTIIGGIFGSLTEQNIENIEKFITEMQKDIEKIDISKNAIFKSSLANVGILPKNTALNYGITGSNLRASGISTDFRKQAQYLAYGDIDFEVKTQTKGDCYSRFVVRIEETKESLKILSQCIEKLKTEIDDTPVQTIENIPAGTGVSFTEAPSGLLTCTIISDGSEKPYRVKFRSGSFYSVQILFGILKDRYYSDILPICGSLGIKEAEVDR